MLKMVARDAILSLENLDGPKKSLQTKQSGEKHAVHWPGKLIKTEPIDRGRLHANLYFSDSGAAIEALVHFWELRFQGLTPWIPQVAYPDAWSEENLQEVEHRLRLSFLIYIDGLKESPMVKDCRQDIKELEQKLEQKTPKNPKWISIDKWEALQKERDGLHLLHIQLGRRLSEFMSALNVLEAYVNARGCMGFQTERDDAWSLFQLKKECSWQQMYCILERECERLQAGLPLYSQRAVILENIQATQVTVLVGETGSGKSTQLVQYLCDAGLCWDGKSIACTQPRRVAALALTKRVAEESRGCYELEDLVSSLGYRDQHLAYITFTTDSALLQFYLMDRNLEQFSCIVIDEAHERSLSTDLLLAMLKECILRRPDLKLVIMSATADAEVFSSYFGGCEILHAVGRKFPVDIRYEPPESESLAGSIDNHLSRVVRKVAALDAEVGEGGILAFLTSQADVECACRQLCGTSALVLPLHGKLQQEDQQLVFEAAPANTRKIIFATNIAETSLTIPDIRYVVDPGLAKEAVFDPRTGMNSLKVSVISQSSAIQRSGRAGRTSHGVCYRLYSEQDFEAMSLHRAPEICTVHLGVAVLKLIALGVHHVESFDFIEPPSPEAISFAVKTLHRLNAIEMQGEWKLTSLGWQMAKLGAEPRLGKIVLDCVAHGYGREGLVLGALLSYAGSVFFRAGSEEEKVFADRRKMRFCHPHGDLFTLMNVYQEWIDTPVKLRKAWCMANNINGRTLRACQDQIKDMEDTLKYVLNIRVPFVWSFSPDRNVMLRKIIMSALMENLAVYSGMERLGHDVVSLGSHALIHPSSAVLVYGDVPEWIVFGDLLFTSKEFLVCVTVVEPEWIQELPHSHEYDVESLKSSRLHQAIIRNLGKTLMARICGRHNLGLAELERLIREDSNQRCMIEHGKSDLHIFAMADKLQHAKDVVAKAVEKERRWIINECFEKRLFEPAVRAPGLLLAAGAMVRQVLMPGEFASVEVFHPEPYTLVDNDLLTLFDNCGEGIAGFQKCVKDAGSGIKWGVVTFRSFKSAELAIEVAHGKNMGHHRLEVVPVLKFDHIKAKFPAIKATIAWLRRRAKGYASFECAEDDIPHIVQSCSGRFICNSVILCRRDRCRENSVFVHGLNAEATPAELQQALERLTGRNIIKVNMPREAPPPFSAAGCRTALAEKIAKYVSADRCQIIVYDGKQWDIHHRALLKFDESVHEAAANAIANLEGTPLSCCQPWQKVVCLPTFQSVVQCNFRIYRVLESELVALMETLKQQNAGLSLFLLPNESGGKRIEMSSTSLAVVARCKAALEKVIEGVPIADRRLDEASMRLLFSREGFRMAKRVEEQTYTSIACDKRTYTAKVFGPSHRTAIALKRVLMELLHLRERERCREFSLRGDGLPRGLMRAVVRRFGVDLAGLQHVAGVPVTMDHRRHALYVHGELEAVTRVKRAVAEVIDLLRGGGGPSSNKAFAYAEPTNDCPICLCPVEKEYKLEGCGHCFCRPCLVNQLESAIRNREGFPITCASEGCTQLLLMVDFTALLTQEQLDELCKVSLGVFVAASRGSYMFCSTPDCPSVYRTSNSGELFVCGACNVSLCTSCHVESHEGLSCEIYRKFKQDPDSSLQAWREGKQHVKNCPECSSIIEKIDGCNHITCKCGKHICWVCLESFAEAPACYAHMSSVHGSLVL